MTAFKMSPVLMLLSSCNVLHYQLPNQEYLITIFKICPFFVLPVNF